jgi:hypothetical protein
MHRRSPGSPGLRAFLEKLFELCEQPKRARARTVLFVSLLLEGLGDAGDHSEVTLACEGGLRAPGPLQEIERDRSLVREQPE